MNIENFIRPNIRALKPYHSARQDYLEGVLLDANENALGSIIEYDDLQLNRYPDPFQHQLRTQLATLNNVNPENVFVGVGSDEVIDILIRIVCTPQKDRILLLEPTYGMYRVAASIHDVFIDSCLLTEDFQIDVDKARDTVTDSTKLIFCCSPNNPTANLLNAEDIRELCSLNTLVVVDEAYIDFAQSPSMVQYLSQYPNLIIMRTLSKAWGLAGIRLGYCLAHPTIISYMMKVKWPYNINSLTSRVALTALRKVDQMKATVQAIIEEREWFRTQLASLPRVQKVYHSDANFILVRTLDANSIYKKLAEHNIIVRNRSSEPRLKECLRITVGTHEENELLLTTWKELFQ
ncbi:MAG: histidinol-phosphate transaminase [Bacteroidetes bacterium]|nr:histidinol-phosphate transaminase [Bacteroidota bacterium]